VVLGTPRTGKSALVARFLGQRFCDDYRPTIEEFHRRVYRVRGELYQLDILDTSGRDPFPALRRISYLTGDLFLLVFSLDSRESFEEVQRLRESVLGAHMAAWQAAGPRRSPTPPRVPMMLAGNKADIELRAVCPTEAMAYVAGQEACGFVEVSAKRDQGVDRLFSALFNIAGLPTELAPAPAVGPRRAVGIASASTAATPRRAAEVPAVVAPTEARRPSVRTDLLALRCRVASGGIGAVGGGGPGGGATCLLQ